MSLVRVTCEAVDAGLGAAVAAGLAGALAHLLGPGRVAHAQTSGMTPAEASERLARLQREFAWVVVETMPDDAEAFDLLRADQVVGVARDPARPLLRARLLAEASRAATRVVVQDTTPLRRGRAAGLARTLGAADAYAVSDPSVETLAALARAVSGRRIGLALGSGSSRGFAHIGALETLAAIGVPIDVIAGSSAGAGIGSVWAMGFTADKIHRRFAELAEHATRPILPLRSLFCGDSLRRHLEHTAEGHCFADALVPFGAVATDLRARAPVLLRAGSLLQAVLASCSMPGLYPPVRIDGRLLVDGGLLAPVPCAAARELGADLVIAVDLEPGRAAPPGASLTATLFACITAMRVHLGRLGLADADVVLRPVDATAPAAGIRDFARAGARYRELGRAAALAARPALERLLPALAGPRTPPTLVLAS